MLPKPNDREAAAIRNMAQNGSAFSSLTDWLDRCLAGQRAANDVLPVNEIQVGQGRAQSVNSIVTILKELVRTSPD